MPANAVMKDLAENGHSYGLYQALRLLQQSGGNVSIRQALSLGFPAGDIVAIAETDGGHEVQVTPLGLYGSGSPLPAFYTEELLEEAASDQEMMRGLFEVVNGRIYDLLFHCWEKNRLSLKVSEQESAADAERIAAVSGLGSHDAHHQALKYAGIFSLRNRSAWGLETILRDAFPGVPVKVTQCITRQVPIPDDQRLYLGGAATRLGDCAVLGATVADATGKIDIIIGPAGYDSFREFFPDTRKRQRLQSLVETYLPEPLEFEVTCLLWDEERGAGTLGAESFSQVGLDMWL